MQEEKCDDCGGIMHQTTDPTNSVKLYYMCKKCNPKNQIRLTGNGCEGCCDGCKDAITFKKEPFYECRVCFCFLCGICGAEDTSCQGCM